MANLTELSQWETGIYRLETTDPVEAGDGGISNEQARLLGNRTKWLYDKLVKLTPKNIGWFSGLNVGQSTGALSRSGNISSAIATNASGGGTEVTVNFANSMTNTNYYLEIFLESLGDFRADNDMYVPVFQKSSPTQARIYFQETGSADQNLKVHVKVISLD